MTATGYTRGPRFLRDPHGATLIPFGAHFVPRSGPDWPWRTDADDFARAFASMAHAGLNTVRIDLIWAAIEPDAGRYDEQHLQVIDRVFDAAEQTGLSLHPTLFVGGEVGDAYWDIPWARGRNPHADEELLDLQAQHAAMLARRWRDRACLLAWDLTDEPPFWIYAGQTSDEDARRWTNTLVDAIRAEDPDHLITIGTASQEIDHGPFRADVVASALDFTCVHPYPIYSPELYPDRLRSRRMTSAAAFETALSRGAGREVMLHEFGASSTQFSPEAIADYDRLLIGTAFGAGAIGVYAWCWTDAETAAYARAPYSRMPHETQFGLVDQHGAARPRLQALTEMQAKITALDLDELASFGPAVDASIPIPHEYVSPYDQEGYRLGVDSPYVPAELAWDPDRSVKPLIRGLLNGYVMAARAGLSVAFPRERIDSSPDTPLILAPAPLTSTTTSLLHVEPDFWPAALERVQAGAVLYLSLSAESAIPELAELAGVAIVDRAPVIDHLDLHFTRDVGDVQSGAAIRLRDGHHEPHLRGIELALVDAESLAESEDGRVIVTVAQRGAGFVVVCAHPIELLLADIPDAHEPADDSWLLYRALGQLGQPATISSAQPAHNPDLTVQRLRGPHGSLSVVTNHTGLPVTTLITSQDAQNSTDSASDSGHTIRTGRNVTIPPYGVTIEAWTTGSAAPAGSAERKFSEETEEGQEEGER